MEIFPPNSPPPAPSAVSFAAFPRVSPTLTLVLTLVTLGFYVPWWLYTRTRVLNRLCPQKPVSSLLTALCLGAYIMLMVLAWQMPEHVSFQEIFTNPELQNVVSAASFVGLLQIIWLVVFCQRLNLCTQAAPGHSLHANYAILVLTNFLILNVAYLQYKINQAIDSKHTPDTPGGILHA